MKRIFISIDISDAVRSQARTHIAGLRSTGLDARVSWVSPEKMHITLRFLGDINEAVLKRLNESVAGLAEDLHTFRIEVSGTGVFPNKSRPTVLWLGIRDQTRELAHLKTELDKRLDRIGLRVKSRRFQPHLTIARLREPHRSRELASRHLDVDFEPIEFDVSGITVYESRLDPDGSKYFKNLVAVFSPVV